MLSPLPIDVAFPFNSSGSMPKINHATLLDTAIPLPPEEEQEKIVDKVDELSRLCESLKLGLSDACEIQRQLASTLVEKAAA